MSQRHGRAGEGKRGRRRWRVRATARVKTAAHSTAARDFLPWSEQQDWRGSGGPETGLAQDHVQRRA
eukprot:3673299-Rhodomonas_salina.1